MGIVSQRLRDSAKGQECTLRVPGVCNHNPETTVLAHLPSPVKGMGNKGNDWHAVFACSACHDAVDNRRLHVVSIATIWLPALEETQRFWFENGYLEIVGDKEPKPRPTSKKSLPPKLSWQSNKLSWQKR